MNNIETKLIEAIKASLHDEQITMEVSNELVSLAKQHQVQNLLYLATKNAELKKKYLISASQSINQECAIDELINCFEINSLDLMLIKGVCTRLRYIDTTMRTMGDIDILINATQSKKVHNMLLELGYENYIEGRKHDTYSKSSFVSLEVHKDLLDGENEYYWYYSDIWKKAIRYKNNQFVYQLSLEDEYIFNIIHLVNHFKNGGIGLRFVVDVYIYEQLDFDRTYVEQELKKMHLLEFYKNIKTLSNIWFGNNENIISSDKTLEQLGDYILNCGIFGNKTNRVNLIAGGNRLKFLIRFCFPGYKSMKSMFPWLIPVLLPFAWALRGIRALLYRRKNVKFILDSTTKGDKEKGNNLIKFYENCGLHAENN